MTTFQTPRPIQVRIVVPAGTVHLIATERSDTVVMVSPSNRSRKADVEAADRTSIELAGERLLVKVPKPRGLASYVRSGGSVDLTLEVPDGSHLDAEGGMAHIRADGRLGDTRIKGGAGEVRLDRTGAADIALGAGGVSVDHIDGRADVTTAGDLRLATIGGDAAVTNHNGRTWIGEVSGRLRVKAANGDIAVKRAGGDVTGTTANGSIQIDEVASGTIVLETSAGGLDIGIRSGTPAWIDARTRFGRVRNSLEAGGPPEDAAATVEVRARTSFGDIVVHRS